LDPFVPLQAFNGQVSAIIFAVMKRFKKVNFDCCLQFCNFILKTVNLATI